jgi:hypothetical protein
LIGSNNHANKKQTLNLLNPCLSVYLPQAWLAGTLRLPAGALWRISKKTTTDERE